MTVTQRLDQTHEDRATIGSDDVIGVSAQGALDNLETQAIAPKVSTAPASVLPSGVGLNESGGVLALRILEAAAEAAFDFVSKPKPLVSVPTADFISHSSYKTGSKCVIRIVPNPDTASRDKALQDQSINDSQLYFDRASLQSTNEVHEERFQLFESFDSETLFLFGERPKIWSFQFLVANANKPSIPQALRAQGAERALEAFMTRFNMDFCDELIRRYERYYRGSQAAKLRARVFLSFEDSLIEATLVGLTASRNSAIPGAVPVGLTFVVHQRSFMGESLTFGSDATLAQLLSSNDQTQLVNRDLRATSIIAPRRSLDEILAQGASDRDEQRAAAAASAAAEQERAALARLAGDSATELEALDSASQSIELQLATTTDEEVRARLLVEQQALDSQASALRATVQDAQALDEAIATGIDEATVAAADADKSAEVSTALLANSSAGDLSQSPQSQVFIVDVISTFGAQRLLKTFIVVSEAAAGVIARGGDPASVGAQADEVVDITGDPDYAQTPDGSVIRQEVVHTS